MEDYYKVLGLKRGASLKEISAAYRSLALIYHPDKRKSSTNSSENDDEKFQKVKAAYQALQDPKIRAELDLQLIGQEERLKRDAQMSAQRKQMRDELLSREKEALNLKKRPAQTEEPTSNVVHNQKPKNKPIVSNEDACLILKCKFPANLEQKLTMEMVKSLLGEYLLALHEMESNFVAEFKDPQEAFKTLCKLPNDVIVKADWYTGYPPENLNIIVSEQVKKTEETTTAMPAKKEVKYSKEFENSILEKLKRKKLEKQQQQ